MRFRSRPWAAARRELKAAVDAAARVLPYRGVRLPEMIAGRTLYVRHRCVTHDDPRRRVSKKEKAPREAPRCPGVPGCRRLPARALPGWRPPRAGRAGGVPVTPGRRQAALIPGCAPQVWPKKMKVLSVFMILVFWG